MGASTSLLTDGEKPALSNSLQKQFYGDTVSKVASLENEKTIPAYSESSGSLEDTIFVVCDAKHVGSHEAVYLGDVYECPEWKDIVHQSGCSNLFLVRTTYKKYLELADAKVLSYRWGQVLSRTCRVNAPGAVSPSEPRLVDLSIDIFRLLKDMEITFLWIDFLSHLNCPTHKTFVINKMGGLYKSRTVLPMYLVDYTANFASTKLSEEATAAEICFLSLRRGWIQQEISFGVLDRIVVEAFVRECISRSRWDLLGTLIRRRALAMKWIYENYTDETKTEKQLADLEDKYIANEYLNQCEVSDLLGLGLMCTRSAPRGGSSAVAAALELMLSKPSEQPNLIISHLINRIISYQAFDPSDIYSSYQLLRSFAESAISYESDAYMAMTQVAALSAGLEWKGEGDVLSNGNLAVLHRCWETVMTLTVEKFGNLILGVHREDLAARTIGLRALLPLIKAKEESSNGGCYRIIVAIPKNWRRRQEEDDQNVITLIYEQKEKHTNIYITNTKHKLPVILPLQGSSPTPVRRLEWSGVVPDLLVSTIGELF